MLDFHSRRKYTDTLYIVVASVCFLMGIVPLLSILYYTLVNGASALNLDFFIKSTPAIGSAGGGILNAIVGSAVVVGIASLFGIPVGVLAGAFLSEYPGKLAYYVRLLAETLTGVPSIVTGIFVYQLIVATTSHFSAWSGGVALGFMIIPIVAISTHESLKLVPPAIREGGLALGISRAKTLIYILLSTARAGVVTGIALAIARVMGETAPLIFTALGSTFLMHSINDPTTTLTILIYDFGTSPYNNAHVMAWGAAFILLFLVLGLNVIVRLASRLKVQGEM